MDKNGQIIRLEYGSNGCQYDHTKNTIKAGGSTATKMLTGWTGLDTP